MVKGYLSFFTVMIGLLSRSIKLKRPPLIFEQKVLILFGLLLVQLLKTFGALTGSNLQIFLLRSEIWFHLAIRDF